MFLFGLLIIDFVDISHKRSIYQKGI